MGMNFRNILWYLVDTDDMEDLWYPTIYIGNETRDNDWVGLVFSYQVPKNVLSYNWLIEIFDFVG